MDETSFLSDRRRTGLRRRSDGRDQMSLLQLDVIFPDCWDGRHLDSPDHKSHMAYSRNWTVLARIR
jgi:hypothetical protein